MEIRAGPETVLFLCCFFGSRTTENAAEKAAQISDMLRFCSGKKEPEN